MLRFASQAPEKPKRPGSALAQAKNEDVHKRGSDAERALRSNRGSVSGSLWRFLQPAVLFEVHWLRHDAVVDDYGHSISSA